MHNYSYNNYLISWWPRCGDGCMIANKLNNDTLKVTGKWSYIPGFGRNGADEYDKDDFITIYSGYM